MACDQRFAGMRHLRVELFAQSQLDHQYAGIASAKKRERAVRRDGADGFRVVVIVAEFFTFLGFFPFHNSRNHAALLEQVVANLTENFRRFAELFRENVAGAIERGLDIGDAFFSVHVTRGFCLRIKRRVGEEGIRERLQAGFTSNLRTRATLRFVGEIQVFEHLLAVGAFNGCAQFGRKFALFVDALDNGCAAVFQLAKIDEPFLEIAQLRVVEIVRYFLSITGDERNCCAFIEKLHGSGDLPRLHIQLGGDALDNLECYGFRHGGLRQPAGSSRAFRTARFTRISLAFHCKPREHVCRVGEAGHFAINAVGPRRAVIEFQHRRRCFFTPLSVSLSVFLSFTLAMTLPTSRLSPALPIAQVDSFASTGQAASGGGVAIARPAMLSVVPLARLSRQALLFTRPVAAILFALACAGVGTAAMAQTPKPINPGTSVTQTPLDETGAQDNGNAAQAASGVPANRADGVVGASGAIDAGAAQSTADTNPFTARQKALDVRSAENNYLYGVKQHDCYSTFFVNHCLDKARDAKREVGQQIRKEQLALDDEQRLQHAQQRDQQTAIKRAQYASEAPQRAASEKASEESFAEKQRQNELSAAQRNAEAPQRAQNQADYDRKQADYQKKLADAAARGVQDAKDREDKAERFAAKQRDAAEHQTEVQSRQKEAAAKQQQRAQQDAIDQAHQQELKQQQQQSK